MLSVGQLTKKVINKYVSYAMHGLANGKLFREVMKEVLSAVLASPKFLYLYDAGEWGKNQAANREY